MRILNRRARHDYQILESFEAGVALTGAEVKSIKEGRADLGGSFAQIRDGEAWLLGANIPLYKGSSGAADYDPLRIRKLLVHRKEIVSLETKIKQKKLTLVPISLYTKGRLVKVKVALGRGKKKYEKRDAKRQKDIQREIERELKN
ncbi:SsrA-binding protein [Candidatus Woesebacteria bacterium]|nr:SsrA-binding protein [Candidatus Woesebacteria bacterium]